MPVLSKLISYGYIQNNFYMDTDGIENPFLMQTVDSVYCSRSNAPERGFR